jgi:PKD domain
VITLSTTGTVLPLETVNVESTNSTFGSGTLLNSKITWNFGDTNSAYNNSIVGFSAAHAYANAGTYTITMTITTPDGQVSVATQQVTISPDTRQTIYVSTSGNDANNGLSASDPIQSLARLQQLLTSNTRVLFQAGDTFTLSTTSEINLAELSHVYLESYGTGAQPILYYDGPAGGGSFIGFDNNSSNIVIQGLTFDSMYLNNDNKQAIPMALIPTGTNISILDNTFLNVGEDVNLQLAPTNVLVQDNTSPNPTALSGYFGWVAGQNITFLGNTVAASTGEAIMRVAGVTDLELAYNNFTNPPETAGGANVSKNTLSTQVGQYVYVYKNTFADGPANAGPLGTAVANPNVQLSDVVFDSNTVNGTTILITAGAEDIMIENNVINGDNGAGITINAQEIGGGFNWTVTNVWIEHNTVTEPGQYGGFLYINNGQASNVTVDYNLFVDPNYQVGNGQAYISVDEPNLDSFSQIMDNVWGNPASVSSWNLGGVFFVGSDPSSQTAWETTAEFESTGVASGDVFETVNLGNTYSVTADGFTAGSDLPNNS